MSRRPLLAAGAFGTTGAWWFHRHRSSAMVNAWRPSVLPGGRAGPLHVRSGGDGHEVVVLLHGLVATGDLFGRPFDDIAGTASVVVPDLLGFGRSLDEQRTAFGPEDHVAALVDALDALGLGGRPVTVGAHSMGACIAMHWAARPGTAVERVVCWGPPVYPSENAVDEAVADSGAMARLFVADTRWARLACEINCAHRTAAGWVAAAVTPSLPVPITRSASLHTWPAYRDAMNELVAGTDWPTLVDQARSAGIPVDLTWGSNDRIGDLEHARALPGVGMQIVADSGHHLPITHADRCVAQLLRS